MTKDIYPSNFPQESDKDFSDRIEKLLVKYLFSNEYAGTALNNVNARQVENDPQEVFVEGFVDIINLTDNVTVLIRREQLLMLNAIMHGIREKGADIETHRFVVLIQNILRDIVGKTHEQAS